MASLEKCEVAEEPRRIGRSNAGRNCRNEFDVEIVPSISLVTCTTLIQWGLGHVPWLGFPLTLLVVYFVVEPLVKKKLLSPKGYYIMWPSTAGLSVVVLSPSDA